MAVTRRPKAAPRGTARSATPKATHKTQRHNSRLILGTLLIAALGVPAALGSTVFILGRTVSDAARTPVMTAMPKASLYPVLANAVPYIRADERALAAGERAEPMFQTAALAPAPSQLQPPPETAPPLAAPAKPDVARAATPLPRPRPQQASAITPREPEPETTASLPAPKTDPVKTPAPTVQQAMRAPLHQPDPDSRVAVYDISAKTVYLPNGQKMEAHSGYAHRMDNPKYIDVKNWGPTPPNIYDLKLREALFHGVRAIRLTPVDESKMFRRDGILAHTYMLGPNGQSNGCISFKDYDKFLQAFLKGHVTRIVVVPSLGNTPLQVVQASAVKKERYAAAAER